MKNLEWRGKSEEWKESEERIMKTKESTREPILKFEFWIAKSSARLRRILEYLENIFFMD